MHRLSFFIWLGTLLAFISFDFLSAAPPPNDAPEFATDLGASDQAVLIGTTLDATGGSHDPLAPNSLAAVWFKWTSTVAGHFSFVGEAGYPIVWTYRASGGTPQTLLAAHNGEFSAEPGGTYFFAVATAAFIGDFRVLVQPVSRPVNDLFANAIELTSATHEVVVLGSGQDSSLEPGEQAPPGGPGSIWYKWVPAVSGRLRVTSKPGMGGAVRAFQLQGTSITDLIPLDSIGLLTAGTTYYFAIYASYPVHMWFESASATVPNDTQETATVLDLSAETTEVKGSTLGATVDGPDQTRGVWYKLVAPRSGLLKSTVHPPRSWDADRFWIRPYITVFVQESGWLRPLTDWNAFEPSVDLDTGRTYFIRVFDSGAGMDFELRLNFRPSGDNDNFADARPFIFTSTGVKSAISTAGSTLQSGEPHPPGAAGSIWYTIPVSTLGRLNWTADSATTLTVYRGTALSNLQKVDPPYLMPGVLYYICVNTFAPEGTTFDLHYELLALTGNENDAFADAITVNERSAVLQANTPEAGSLEADEPGVPPNEGIMQGTLWWKYVPPTSGWLILHPERTRCLLYSGSSVASLNKLNQDASLTRVNAGETYHIQVEHSVFRHGKVNLEFHEHAANDHFNDAKLIENLPLDGSPVMVRGHTAEATREAGEPGLEGGAGTTVWYRWIAPFDGTFSSYFSHFTSQKVVTYKGQTLSTLEPVDTYRFPVVRGETIYIQVDDASPSPKMFVLSVSARTMNDKLEEARELDVFDSKYADIRAATLDAGEPSHMAGLHKSIWWKFRVPLNVTRIQINLNLNGSGALSAFRGNEPAFESLSLLARLEGSGYISPLEISNLVESETIYIAAAAAENVTDEVRIKIDQLDGFSNFLQSQTIYFTQPETATYGGPPVVLGTYVTSGLPAQFTVRRGPATVQGNNLFIHGTGIITVQASQPGDQWYAPAADAFRTFGVRKASQTIAFDGIAPGGASVPLRASSSAGLPVQFSIAAGTASIENNLLVNIGEGPITILAAQNGDANHEPAEPVAQTVVLRKYAQSIQFTSLPDVPFGTSSWPLQAEASSALPVTFSLVSGNATISGGVVLIHGPGSITIRASQAGNDLFAPAPNTERSFQVSGMPQTIHFPELPPFNLGSPPINLAASASSGLPVSFELVSGPAQLSGPVLQPMGEGLVVIRAIQLGNANYLPASMERTLLVSARTGQSIQFEALADVPASTTSVSLVASTTSGLPVAFSVVSGNATISGSVVLIHGAGQVTVRASQPGNELFAPASAVERSFQVTALAQTITFSELPLFSLGSPPLNLAASASSGLPVTFELVSGSAQLSGNVLQPTGEGLVVVRAIQLGNEIYLPASMERTLRVSAKAGQSIQFDALADLPAGTTSATLAANSSSGLPVSFTLVSGNASLSGNVLTISGQGEIRVRASQPGNEQFSPAADVERSFRVRGVEQTITFSEVAPLYVGSPAVKLVASASSGLPVEFELVSGPAVLTGDLLEVNGPGTIIVHATQSGDAVYEPTALQRELEARSRIAQSIEFDALPNVPVGTPAIQLIAASTSGLPVTFTLLSTNASLDGSVLTLLGTGQITVRASQSGDLMFAPAQDVDRSFEVTRLPQEITFSPVPSLRFGDAPVTLNATASSGLAVTFDLVVGSAELNGNELRATAVGAVTIRARQAGNDSYLPAPFVTKTLFVRKGLQTISFFDLPQSVTLHSRVTVAPFATSGLAVSLRIASGPAVLEEGNILHATGLGEIQIEATQSGNSDFEAATVVHTITVLPPAVHVNASAGKLQLTWPETAIGFRIESAPSLEGPWTLISPDETQRPGIELPTDATRGFFRLRAE